MRRIVNVLSLIGLFLLVFTATAFAQGSLAGADVSILDLAKPVYEAVMSGDWWIATSFGLVLMVAAFKRYAPGKAGELANTDLGGALLVLVGAFGGALGTGLLASGTDVLTLALVTASFKIAFSAAGGYALVKKLLVPVVEKIALKAPAWAQPLFAMLLWAFAKPEPVAIVDAEKAGQAAVDAAPAPGIDSVVGPPTEID